MNRRRFLSAAIAACFSPPVVPAPITVFKTASLGWTTCMPYALGERVNFVGIDHAYMDDRAVTCMVVRQHGRTFVQLMWNF